MIDTVTESKEEIVRITESSANEYSLIQNELKDLTEKIEFLYCGIGPARFARESGEEQARPSEQEVSYT
ncbi:hypothetical protein [Exiguobacterium aurantiacum]|uniref:hypothetical protein n=1 Tax=Exiguobacterium aurantiacum TaxID=33987 RepID=UPI0021001F07|nr:hypothetical protein [Exiguobacterium aurantiacum]